MRYFINTELTSFVSAEQATGGIQAVFAYPTSQLPNTLLQAFQAEVHSLKETCFFDFHFSNSSGEFDIFLKSDSLANEQYKVQLHNVCATKLLRITQQALALSKASGLSR